MTDLGSPAASTDSRNLTNAHYGNAVLATIAHRKEKRRIEELEGARDVVFHQRPRGEEQSVFDEFAHLESLYFGGGGGGGGASPAAAPEGSRAIVELVPGQVAAAAAAGTEGQVPHAGDAREIRSEVDFVQREYLSQERAERHRFAKYYKDDERQEHTCSRTAGIG